jgi:alpha-ribazole phosphatase
MKLILLRHGKTLANEQHLYCGSTDIALSDVGVKELEQLKNTTPYPDISGMRILTSGMKRCEETLRLLYGEVAHETDPAFCEMDFGQFEMRSYEELKNDPAYSAWIDGDNEKNTAPGGESGIRMRGRVLASLEGITACGRDTLLITHGGVIAVIMAFLFPQEQKNRYDWQPPCGGGYIIDLNEARHGTYERIPI